LGLKKPWKPVTVVFEGAPGTGKSLVLNCLLGPPNLKEWLYRSDKFSPASFVSQSATVSSIKLKDIDLLPKIKNKVLITPKSSMMGIYQAYRAHIPPKSSMIDTKLFK